MNTLDVKDTSDLGNVAKETTDESPKQAIGKTVILEEIQEATETIQDYEHFSTQGDPKSENTVLEGTIQSRKSSNGETQFETNTKALTYEGKSIHDGYNKTSTEFQESFDDEIFTINSSTVISNNSKTANKTSCTEAQVDLFQDQFKVLKRMIEHPKSPNSVELLKDIGESEAKVDQSQNKFDLSKDTTASVLDSESCETDGNIASERQPQKDTSFENGQNVDRCVTEICLKTSRLYLSAPITIEAEEHPGASKKGDEVVPIPESFADKLGFNTPITNENIRDPIRQDIKETEHMDEQGSESLANMPGLTTSITIDTIREVSVSLKVDDCDNFEKKNKTVKHTRIVMIGITGCGKSATGNSLLGKNVFKTSAGSTSMTSRCEYGRRDFEDRILDVVDTPGLYDTDRSEENVKRELARCICMLTPGPHAFLIVIRVGRFNEQEQKTVESLVNFFGEDGFLKYSIVIITRKDELEYEQTTLETFINDSPPALKQIINQCGGRCFAVNNRLRNKDEMDNQTKQLVSLIDDMVNTSGGNCYTHSLFAEVEKERQKKLDEEKKRKEEEERLKLENEKEMMRQKREMEMKLREQEIEIDKERQRWKQIERDMEREKRKRRKKKEEKKRERENERRNLELERERETIRRQEMEIKERERELDRERERARIQRERYEIAREEANKKSHCIVS